MENKKPISEIVKDPEWQKLRESLIGKWKENPKWCIKQLRNFLGDVKKADKDKLRIVLNYTISSAFRTGKISSRENPEIQKLRTEISVELKKRKFKTKGE